MSFRKLMTLFFFLFIISGCGSDGNGYVNQGSVASPVNIGTAPATYLATIAGNSSALSSDSFSYYVVTLPNVSTLYNIKISALTTDADLTIYSDAGFTTTVGNSAESGTVDEVVSFIPTSINQPLYIKVSNNDVVGTAFALDVRETF